MHEMWLRVFPADVCVKNKKANIEHRVNVVFNQHLKTTWANETVFAFRNVWILRFIQ